MLGSLVTILSVPSQPVILCPGLNVIFEHALWYQISLCLASFTLKAFQSFSASVATELCRTGDTHLRCFGSRNRNLAQREVLFWTLARCKLLEEHDGGNMTQSWKRRNCQREYIIKVLAKYLVIVIIYMRQQLPQIASCKISELDFTLWPRESCVII